MNSEYFNEVALDAESLSRIEDLASIRACDPIDRGGIALRERMFKYGVEQCGLNKYFKHSVDYNFNINSSARSGYGMSVVLGAEYLLPEEGIEVEQDVQDERMAKEKHDKFLLKTMRMI